MEKVGIITLNGYFNYGNRLQNYALQETLKKYKFNVETVWIEKERKKNNKKVNKLKTALKKPSILIKKINNKIYLNPLNAKRQTRFKEFSKNYIDETNESISEMNLPRYMLDEYDYFVTGSDQVWNPYYTNSSSLYFLAFAPNEKRIAYAPSFGVSDIPKDYKERYTEWLNSMNHLSVREDAGADIIKELTNREAEVLADPTFLLSKEDWLSIAKPFSNKPKEAYLLTYFLGDIPKEVNKLISYYSKMYELKIVNLAQPKYKEFYLADPAEFLDFIYSATLFFTDSFHGTVFSILFETPFIVTDRKAKIPSMNSRIQTLLIKYNLENRHINKMSTDNPLDIDFNHVADILETERGKADKYLKKALNK